VCGENLPYCDRKRLKHLHNWSKATVISEFTSHRRVLGDDKRRLSGYVTQLSNDIDRLFDDYSRRNSAKVGQLDEKSVESVVGLFLGGVYQGLGL